jgi:hypothetical protein
MNVFTALLLAITALANQYAEYLKNKRENEIDELEDEIDRLAADGSPASKLRLERLSKRIKRKTQLLTAIYTRDDNTK